MTTSADWIPDLKLMLEGLVDEFVVQGFRPEDVLDAVEQQISELRAAYDKDPDLADDGAAGLRTTGRAQSGRRQPPP